MIKPPKTMLHISAPKRPPLSVLVVVYVFAILAGLAALVSCYIGVNMLMLSIESQKWPSVDGMVRSTRIVQSADGHAQFYTPEIDYSYTVNGQELSSKTVSMDDHALYDLSDAQSVISRYPVGQTVKVFYQPSSPQQSLLEIGNNDGAWFALKLSGMFLIAALLIFFGVPRLYVFIRNAQDVLSRSDAIP